MDVRLRELQRRWAQSGDLDDEVALLQERVRVGELARARLDLAAHAGHRAAELAGGAPAADPELGARLRGLERWGQPVLARGVLAVTAATIPWAPAGPVRQACESVQAAGEAWLLDDALESLRGLLAAMLSGGSLRAQVRSRVTTVLEDMLAGFRAGRSPQALLDGVMESFVTGLASVPALSAESLVLIAQWVTQVLAAEDAARRPTGQPDPADLLARFVGRLDGALAAAEAALAAEVGAWALGYPDPLQGRVAARTSG